VSRDILSGSFQQILLNYKNSTIFDVSGKKSLIGKRKSFEDLILGENNFLIACCNSHCNSHRNNSNKFIGSLQIPLWIGGLVNFKQTRVYCKASSLLHNTDDVLHM